MSRKSRRLAKPLITLMDRPSGYTPPSADDPRLEPAFLTQYKGNLFVDTKGWRSQAKTFYAHAICRTPLDLKLHVQRITLHAEMKDPDISGALFDLFLVLEKRGTALRKRMLALAKPLLLAEDYILFHRQLGEVVASPPPVRSAPRSSMLSRGISGNTRLIEKLTSTSRLENDPLEEARQQIEFGQVEPALETLETALLANPARLEIHHALLEIYWHARQRRRVADMLQRLQDHENPALSEWQHLLSKLETNHDSTENNNTN